MTEPTSQLQERHGDLPAAVDELLDADSPAGKAVVKVCDDQGADVVDLLEGEHADRLLAALVNLGISARLNGLTKWQPPAPE